MTAETTNHFDVVATFTKFANLGAAWVMWLMLALAFVLTVLVIERIALFWRTRVDASSVGRQLFEHLERGDLDQARQLVAAGRAMEERIISDGLEAWTRGSRAVEQVMKSSVERERQRYERYLGYMGTVGSNAPFIGLLGTVIGIVISFQQLAVNPKGGMAVVGPGIAEALASTAVGLMVAIPAVVAFNAFRGSLTKRLGNVEFLSGIVLSQLQTEPK
jgi:biopolymer transport protein ExbB